MERTMRRPPRNPELEAAIVADPESPDAYLVYGDWLLEQGEALGELVSVQAAIAKHAASNSLLEGADSKKSRHLAHREKTLLAENARGWLGYFAKYKHTWRFGFLESLILTEPGREDFIELLDLVAARFLRDLELEVLGHRVFENAELISAIGELGLPPILRKLTLAPTSTARAVDVGSLRVLWPRLARLKELSIGAGKVELGAIDLPEVETVTLTTNAAQSTTRALTNARWPKLQRLSIDFTAYQYEPMDPESLEPLVDALGQLTLLQHLGLSTTWSGDTLLDCLLAPKRSEQLARITSLSLARDAITDTGAETLVKNKARLDHLELIDLRENYFTKPTCEALVKAFGKKVDVTSQGNADQYANYDADGDEEPYDGIDE
jgi:uncharacterized protein (TIGR02996 family)